MDSSIGISGAGRPVNERERRRVEYRPERIKMLDERYRDKLLSFMGYQCGDEVRKKVVEFLEEYSYPCGCNSGSGCMECCPPDDGET